VQDVPRYVGTIVSTVPRTGSEDEQFAVLEQELSVGDE
jgi:hypothetical protein